MKVKDKKVYYCEFCKKHGLSASSMSKHEKHCIKNLDRVCRLCEYGKWTSITKENKIKIIDKIKSLMFYPQNCEMGIPAEQIKQPNIKEIQEIATEYGWDGCPNCLFSIIVFTGIQNFPYQLDWDYKKELASVWEDINSDKENLL